MGGKPIFRMKGRVSKDRSKKRAFTGFVVLVVLMLVSSSAVSALEGTNNTTEAPPDVEKEGIDEDLVNNVWNASQNFTDEIIQEINISEEGSGEEGAIDNLITLMRLTLAFTVDVLDALQGSDTNETVEEQNLTPAEAGFVSEDEVEDAYQYLRLLQKGNLCEESLDMIDAGEMGSW